MWLKRIPAGRLCTWLHILAEDGDLLGAELGQLGPEADVPALDDVQLELLLAASLCELTHVLPQTLVNPTLTCSASPPVFSPAVPVPEAV